MIRSQVQCLFHYPYFLAEIIQYKTLIIESAVEVPRKPSKTGHITQHFDIITTPDEEQSDQKDKVDDADADADADEDDDATITITNVQIQPTNQINVQIKRPSVNSVLAGSRPKEVVSYQRFGRVDKKTLTYPFKCHLCGFSCRFKDSLLSHFKQVHPY